MRKIYRNDIIYISLILSTAGLAAYVMQNAFQEPITFKEFFEMISK